MINLNEQRIFPGVAYNGSQLYVKRHQYQAVQKVTRDEPERWEEEQEHEERGKYEKPGLDYSTKSKLD